ncbi:membrane dipeptidase [Maricaulis sp.]|uniref:dipeptidase n=1 Tax=Maricaulis sp. TaxID=1486257 RepID=UPI002634E652|nr:membrane dipeptidase [Maricaulis sp.]
MLRVIVIVLGAVLALAAVGLFRVVPARVDAAMNVVQPHEPYEIAPGARDLHASLRVADLHSDMLLWMRDPEDWNGRGHTDLPRLRAGGVALQVFSSVTKSPSGQNYDSNTGDSDRITGLAIAQRWPVDSWTSLFARARYQARRLHRLEARSDGALVIARDRQQMEQALDARERNSELLITILATEGAHPLEGDLSKIDGLYDEGYRLIGLHHFFDNELGGSLHGLSNAGLTEFGREAVERMLARDMIIDLAHSSYAVVEEVLAMTDRPLIISHTGIYGHCQVRRNIPDRLMQAIAAEGGLIGVGFWGDVTCDDTPRGVAETIIAAVELVGVEHVALGSDFDGTVTTTFDGSEFAVLTQELLALGMSEADIRLVTGENAIRFFLENLPDASNG